MLDHFTGNAKIFQSLSLWTDRIKCCFEIDEVDQTWQLLVQALLNHLILAENMILAGVVLPGVCLIFPHPLVNCLFDSACEHDC